MTKARAEELTELKICGRVLYIMGRKDPLLCHLPPGHTGACRPKGYISVVEDECGSNEDDDEE